MNSVISFIHCLIILGGRWCWAVLGRYWAVLGGLGTVLGCRSAVLGCFAVFANGTQRKSPRICARLAASCRAGPRAKNVPQYHQGKTKVGFPRAEKIAKSSNWLASPRGQPRKTRCPFNIVELRAQTSSAASLVGPNQPIYICVNKVLCLSYCYGFSVTVDPKRWCPLKTVVSVKGVRSTKRGGVR